MEYQYYYRKPGCPAQDGFDADCICWHDEGGGPFENERHDDEIQTVAWREKPNKSK